MLASFKNNFINKNRSIYLYKIRVQSLSYRFLDVRQDDSILLEHGSDTMLIDSGEIGKGDDIATYVKSEGITSLDYLVATHPYLDHIGVISVILKDFPIDHFVDSGHPYTSKTYENMLTTIDKKGIQFLIPKRGKKSTSHQVSISRF